MEYLRDYFHISETLAGVTFLALANGAPDVMVSFSAGSLDSDGISLSLGALFGAGLFVCTFVYGYCVIICNNSLKVEINETGRDIFFYIIANGMIILFCILGYVTWPLAIFYLCIYGVFICYVMYVES